MLSAINFLEAHMNNNDDMHVIPVSDRDGKHFMRVKSGHRIEIGWSSDFRIGSIPNRPHDLSSVEYLKSLNLRVRWLPEVGNQGLSEQLQHCNIYYVVDGVEQLPNWDSTPRFFCGRFGFFPDNSTIQREYHRLYEMEDCRKKITVGAAARIKLRMLKRTGCIHNHSKVDA